MFYRIYNVFGSMGIRNYCEHIVVSPKVSRTRGARCTGSVLKSWV